MTPATVNAYYNPSMNDVNFPAGVLMPPLYDPKMDDAPNYGNTGGTIGHELVHGFDDEGRQFDGDGNLRDWWTAADAAAFEERAQCIRDQYASYRVIDDIFINADLTSGEDIADLGGLVLAWHAWKKETEGQRLEAGRRPGPGPEVLCRFRTVGLCRRAAGVPAPARGDRPAFAAALPHQRRGRQHAGVQGRLRLPR